MFLNYFLNIFKKIKKLFFAIAKPSKIAKHSKLSQLCKLNTKLSHIKQTTKSTRFFLHKTLFSYLEDKAISTYTNLDFYSLLNSLLNKGLKQSSIKQIISYASSAFNLAIDLNIISQNPTTKTLKKLKPSIQNNKKTFKLSQIKSLLLTSASELQTFLYFAFFTGARAGEILALTNSSINYKQNYILITLNKTRYGISTPKNNQSRKIYMPELLKEHLQKIKFKSFTQSYHSIYYSFKKLLKKHNIKQKSLHSTRHTYASLLTNKNVNLPLIAKLLGHKDISMLSKVYSHNIYSRAEQQKLKKIFNLRKF